MRKGSRDLSKNNQYDSRSETVEIGRNLHTATTKCQWSQVLFTGSVDHAAFGRTSMKAWRKLK